MKLKETGFDAAGDIERNDLQYLVGRAITSVYMDDRGYLVFTGRNLKPMFKVHPEYLFDGSGNYFNPL